MRKKIFGILMAAALALTLGACSDTAGVNVTVSKVKTDGNLADSSYSARLQAVSEVTVTPTVSAKITDVNAEVGGHVKQGDVLFTLDPTNIQNSYNQAKAAYDMAVINYDNAKNGSAASTRLKLQQAVDSAKIAASSAQVAYDTAKSNADRISYMVSIGEESTYDLQQAQSALANAQNQLDGANLNLTSAQQTLQINTATLIPESINAAEKQVESAKAALNTAQSAMDNTKITAPISGVVASLNATAGEMASPAATSATILDPASLKMVLAVTENDVLRLKEGMSVAVTLDGVDESYTGTIQTVAPQASQDTALFDVTVQLDNVSGALRAGMMATARFSNGAENTALYVPKQSVVQEDGNSYVYVVSGSTVKKTPVTLGSEKNLYIAVTSGLTADDTVVAQGADKVQDGGTVHIIQSID